MLPDLNIQKHSLFMLSEVSGSPIDEWTSDECSYINIIHTAS